MTNIMSREVLKPKWETLAQPAAILNHRAKYIDLDEAFWPIYDAVHDYTMTSVERLYDLYKSVEYVVKAGIPGDIIECGVWRGGSMMLVAHTLNALGVSDRRLQLFDTFEGLPYPDSENDVDLIGNHASERWREGWIKVDIDQVRENMATCEYSGKIELHPGMVEMTLIPEALSGEYAIVRLDTDWEASTRVELRMLWDRLSPGGILVIDDFGHWHGCRVAVDDFFADKPVKLHRVDYSCRTVQKHG
jgi:O-methyltransferase